MNYLVILCGLLLPVACLNAKTSTAPEESRPPSTELEMRNFLNRHVVLIPQEGLAIEPYDYYFSQGLLKWDKLTSLQVMDPGPKPELGKDNIIDKAALKQALKIWQPKADRWNAAMDASGFKGAAPVVNPAAGRGRAFVFRDFVVPRMLDQAEREKRQPLIFVHGGMNTLKGAIERAYALTPVMKQDGYYPIFICWNSSLISSWWQHIVSTRNGRDGSGDTLLMKSITVPTYLATDIATSVVRLPRSLLDLTRSTTKPHFENDYPEVQDSLTRFLALRNAMQAAGGSARPSGFCEGNALALVKRINSWRSLDRAEPISLDDLNLSLARGWTSVHRDPSSSNWRPIDVSLGRDTRKFGMDTLTRQLGGWGCFPSKLLVIGAFSGAGSEAWGVMLRRVEMMFHHENSYQPGVGSAKFSAGSSHYNETNPDTRRSSSTGVGALAVLLREIESRQKSGRLGPVTLIGHSMGAIVSNRALAEFPSINYQRVVYLAAAASVIDTHTSVVPYLQAHPQTHFHNVCLHPRAEELEGSWSQRWWGEFVPRGSLLVWIDDLLNNPRTLQERTMGSFENALLASSLFPPAIQGQMHMTALSVGPYPIIANNKETIESAQTHGSFGDHKFWQSGFATEAGNKARTPYALSDEEKPKKIPHP